MPKSAPPISLLVIVISLLYGATFSNGYVWDDWILFINSPALRAGDISWHALSRPILDGTTYFRPAVLLTFALEFKFAGVSAFVSHTINLLIHIANVLLVYFLARQIVERLGLSQPRIRACVAGLVYGTHPSLVESVAWASGRFDLMVTLFTLCALVANASARNERTRFIVIGICFAGALGSKELGIALPALLFLQRLLMSPSEPGPVARRGLCILRQERAVLILCACILGAYLVLRIVSVHGLIHVDETVSRGTSNVFDRSLLALNTFAFYFREALFPFLSVGPFHPLDLEAVKSGVGMLTALFAAGILALILVLANRGVPTGLLLLSSIITLLPVVHIVPITIGSNIGQDRFLTLPLAFGVIALSLVSVWETHLIQKKVQLLIAVLLATFWIPAAALTTKVTASQWRSDLSLWTWAYYQHPDFPMAQLNFISTAMMNGRPELAKVVFDKLLEKGPLEAKIQMAYGSYLIATGEHDEGSRFIEGALLAYPPRHKMSARELSKYRAAENLSNTMASAYSALATAHQLKGEFEEALEDIELSLWYKPQWPTLLFQRSNILLALERDAESQKAFQNASYLTLPSQLPSEKSRRAAYIKKLCRTFPSANEQLCRDQASRAGGASG